MLFEEVDGGDFKRGDVGGDPGDGGKASGLGDGEDHAVDAADFGVGDGLWTAVSSRSTFGKQKEKQGLGGKVGEKRTLSRR